MSVAFDENKEFLSLEVKTMEVSKVLRVIGVVVGFAGIVTALAGVFAGDGRIWGFRRSIYSFAQAY